MDLSKLAKLSCLEIKEEDKNYFTSSLTDVIQMMDNIADLKEKEKNDDLNRIITMDSIEEKSTYGESFLKDKTSIDRSYTYKGVHLEQGVFLAPKVIKKD